MAVKTKLFGQKMDHRLLQYGPLEARCPLTAGAMDHQQVQSGTPAQIPIYELQLQILAGFWS